MSKKRVLLLSEGFGSGHTQAAHALSEGLKQLNPDLSTKVFELGSFLNPTVAPLIISAYRKTVSSQPKVVGMMYRSNYRKPTNGIAKLALHRLFYTQALRIVRQLKPDLIICTHPIPNMIISRLKKDRINTPLITVITDYDAHGSWVNPEVNQYLVSTTIVKQRLLDKGVSENQVSVTGIPIHPKFWKTIDRDHIRSRFHLQNLPTVLIMGGGWGLLHEDSALSYMTKWRETTQLIICVGSNDDMRKKLLDDPLFQHHNIHIIGFTAYINELMDVCDLLVTKPGGMTCTEGFNKALPMLFYEPIPGQEEENCDHFINMGFGEMLTSNDTVDRWFKLLHEEQSLLEYRQKLKNTRDNTYSPQACPKAVLQFM
ncbi:MAG: UDP-N-acetylglucosamine--LPS N-acetylglucosamine transferase [Candidatus Pristimantibacillus lignocellulolyticus]|uniref:UDP-N-acetylglucosamine--LPS N-acetylglucosamine transferase n=1 Tax=Candidatus Pristimantibacillus lignocellulolyticus TaxID=2994561 RepID=A0A9J6ZFR8_9BACL|nr:MAG: UDP-N-acetylglucosamine--LPS N-acetylglucosamine transferase [Candidatus Pristimantibacillus lignocellulolyticus]